MAMEVAMDPRSELLMKDFILISIWFCDVNANAAVAAS